MVQGKKAFNNSKPKFAEVVIGGSEAKEMRVAANGRPSRSPYLKLVYPNGVLEGKPTVVPDSVALLPSPLSRGGDDQGERVDWRGRDQVQASHAGPIWETFRAWAANTILDVPKDSLIFRALNYLLRNYDEWTHYLSIPEMPIDNTDTERLIRDMVMGKKSYLFCRDLDACRRAAMMYSLFGACKVLGKNSERWLSYVLKNIKTMPKDKLYTLLPEFWENEG